MSLQDGARTALANIATAFPGVAVTVVSGGVTGTGTRAPDVADAGLSDWGETGGETSAVRVSAGTFAEPGKGAHITVNGEAAMVTGSRLDPVGANWIISYRKTNPVSGI